MPKSKPRLEVSYFVNLNGDHLSVGKARSASPDIWSKAEAARVAFEIAQKVQRDVLRQLTRRVVKPSVPLEAA